MTPYDGSPLQLETKSKNHLRELSTLVQKGRSRSNRDALGEIACLGGAVELGFGGEVLLEEFSLIFHHKGLIS